MLIDETIASLANKLKKKEISPVDIAKECLKQIEKQNPKINAFITQVDSKAVLDQAKKIKLTTPLSGIPYVLKDVYVTKDLRTTAASNVLSDYIPQYDATVVHKVNSAGSILLGKMNMDAWGHGGSTENTDFGPAKNPWDITRVAGGSGGGPAAAIVSRMCSFAIGEDTGGSIRNPAGWCGITGLKVTYGRVSRYGSIAYASSFDSVGPTAKTAEDCALILQHIAGQDPHDATSSPLPVGDYLSRLEEGIQGKVIGVPKEFMGEGLDPKVKKLILVAAQKFTDLGAKIEEVSLPTSKYAISVYYLLAPSETSSNLARYDGIRYGNGRDKFTPETMRRIMIGTYALSAGYYDAYYKKAQQARTLIIKDYQKVFTKCDLILSPISPTPPTKLGELINDPVKNMLADIYTVTTNTAGIPALALPCGFTRSGLPIGMQLQGPMFSEEVLLQAGYAYQQVTDWHVRKPQL
ncbi:MAG: Glutamyl-tRNA(Gln) amidotransferase subunit A [Candidatus Amesbacteria bacterium GW2011_GWB1_47_26]|uniref:Glutamyl-tRNA(Gln) amidotransferase subunit A n=1 Tax=Candidatus Amesbacteria bacterium GW2011_GWC2_45_19 TaxID=1618366 RepID=A0A0G1Q3R0_9BACT|nr:MAG: Glutamyl-tRNA(Gln) amidotransferase subunit A [Candidatus Amesbacteria bacterium GW2011_GWC2_45_19]KKU68949.1 MAG: Glutamyl-tRNA(Gln) amidotransferase subunit A [Microgenomates group bacterium GW2011_GWC1_47_20]KKU73623.1 MAG: Glutamyl-tRNA(Gln) amidotransferase subunit A [Candidatus Amesbacteria bacterium GW2011_GWB1_47_26]